MKSYPYVPNMVQAITVLTVLKMMTKAQTSCGSGSMANGGKVMYERLPNIQLQGFDDDIVRDTAPPFMVLEKCEDLCLRDRASTNIVRTCTSFDFQPGSRIATYNGGPEYEESTCYLTAEQARPEGIGSLMLVPNSVHFTEVCLTSNRPERECPNRRYIFERHPRKKLKLPGPDMKEMPANNRSDCEDKCLNEFSFVCRSATYDSAMRTCTLSRFTRRTHPELLQDDPDSDYLENTCLNAERRCDGLAVFIKEENKRLGGPFEVDLFTNLTLEGCQEMCVRAEKYFCRSIEYDEMTKQCTISEEDSISQKDEIGIASSPTHHFYDFACLDSPRGSEYPDNSVTSHLFTGKKPDTAFQRYRNSRLGGEHHSEISGRSLSECLDECLRQPSFQCRSAEYSERYRTCRLTRYNQKDGMRIIYDADYDYYENLMLGGEGESGGQRPSLDGGNPIYGPNEPYPNKDPYRPGGNAPHLPPSSEGGRFPPGGGGGRYPPPASGGRYPPPTAGGRYPPSSSGSSRYPPPFGSDRYPPPPPRYPPSSGGRPYPPTGSWSSTSISGSGGGGIGGRPYDRYPSGAGGIYDRYPPRPGGGASYPYPESGRYPPPHVGSGGNIDIGRYPGRYPPGDRFPYYPPSAGGRPPIRNYDRDRYHDNRWGSGSYRGGYNERPGGRYGDDRFNIGGNRYNGYYGDERDTDSRWLLRPDRRPGGRPVDSRPPAYDSRPPYDNLRPGIDSRPPYDNLRPGIDGRPPYDRPALDGRPPYDAARPGLDGRPPYDTGRPGLDGRPPYDSVRPGLDGRPPYDSARPVLDGRPPYDGGRPGIDGRPPYDRPYGGRPIAPLDRPASGGAYRPFSPGPDGPIYDSFGGVGVNRPYSSRCDEGDNFRQIGPRQRIRKEYIRRFIYSPSLLQCQRDCAESRDFICRSFNFRDPQVALDNSRDNCELSDRDSRDLDLNNPRFFENTRAYDFYERSNGRLGVDGECLDVSQVCNEDGMEFTLRTPEGFYGRIYTYGFYDRCFFRGNGGTVNVLRISGAQGYPECGTQRYADTMTNIVVVQFSDYVQTGSDKRFNLTCLFRGPGEAIVSSGFIGAGSGSPIPIEYLPAENTLSSKVRLMILYQGRPTTTIAVGDPLTFRLEAQDGYNYVTDIFATNVIARDPYSGRSVQLIDRFGCPVDPYVFPELDRGRNGDSLEARFNAFKIPESNFLVFEATVRTCRDGCQPAYCQTGPGRSEPSFGRRRRSLNTTQIEGDNSTTALLEEIEPDANDTSVSFLSNRLDETTPAPENDKETEYVREMIEVFDSREELQQEARRAEMLPETVCLTPGEYHGLVTAVLALVAILLTVALIAGLAYRRYWVVMKKNLIADRSSSNLSSSYPNTRSSGGGMSIFNVGLQKQFAAFGRSRIFPGLQGNATDVVDVDCPSTSPGGPFEDPSEPIYTDPSLFERSRSLRSIAVSQKRRKSIGQQQQQQI